MFPEFHSQALCCCLFVCFLFVCLFVAITVLPESTIMIDNNIDVFRLRCLDVCAVYTSILSCAMKSFKLIYFYF